MTWLQCRDRNWLVYCVGVGKYLGFGCASNLRCFLWLGIEIDLILEWGSNRLDFSCGVKMNLIFVWDRSWLRLSVGVERTWFLWWVSKSAVCWPKLTCFECDGRLVWFWCGRWRSKLAWSLDVGCLSIGFGLSIEIDLVFCLGDRHWRHFSVRHQTWLEFSLGIGIYLFCFRESKRTWFWYLDRNWPGFCVTMFDRK